MHFPDFQNEYMFVWVAKFLVIISLQNFLKYCTVDSSSARSNENSFPRNVLSRAVGSVFLKLYDGLIFDFFGGSARSSCL